MMLLMPPHNEVMIIDRATVVTGSFNFAIAAEEMKAESLPTIRSNEPAARYVRN